MKKLTTTDFGKLSKKAIDEATKCLKSLESITNPQAKEFFLKYYSGKENQKGVDPQQMFKFFSIYIKNNFGLIITDTSSNYGLFCKIIDADGSLEVDKEELTQFFDEYIDF